MPWVTILGMTPSKLDSRSNAPHDIREPMASAYALPLGIIDALLPLARRRTWHAGDTVVNSGTLVNHVSVCVSGRFRVVLSSANGKAMLMRFLGKGELFGVPSVIALTPFPTDVVCDRDGETLEVPRQAFEQAIKDHPDLALALIRSLSIRVTELFSLMEDDLLPSLSARVQQCLFRLASHNGQIDKAGNVSLNLSQQDIAQAVNGSRQKVNQELKRLEREGALVLGYRNITLLKQTVFNVSVTQNAHGKSATLSSHR